jgi:RecA/RadA recombinase
VPTSVTDPAVENAAYDLMLNPPEMTKLAKDHLKRLRKKVNDALTEPARGKIIGTGIIGVDLILQRGVNFGSCHEFFGLSKSAKSYIMQKVGVMGQRVLPDCYVVILDRENAYDRARVMSVGFDMNRTVIVPSRMIPEPEHAFDVMREQADDIEKAHIKMLDNPETEDGDEKDPTNSEAKKGKRAPLYCRNFDAVRSPHIIFIIDSLPAFSEQEEMVEDQGRRAKKWHALLRRVTGFLDSKIMVLLSNHIIYKPGYVTAQSKTSGLAIDYYRDCGIGLTRHCDLVDAHGVQIGTYISANVDKTRRGPSGAKTFFPIYFRGGAPQFSGILPYMEYLGLAEISNKTAYKGDPSRVYPNYQIHAIGKKISEQDPVEFEKFVREHNLLQLIGQREKEIIAI